jgi:hypothetical protein
MPETHDLGPLFVHPVALERGTPVLHRAPTNEIEEPFRRSNSLVVRLFGTTKGWVFGWWKHDPDRTEDEALLAALRLGDHGGHGEEALVYADPAPEDEDRPEGEDARGGVGDAGDARPAVIYFR